MTENCREKPAHLDARYGAQFEDVSIAASYRARPPYSKSFFAALHDLHAPGCRRILELGCGTGDVTLGLPDQAERIDAIEPSSAMLNVARQRDGADDPRIRWIHARAEETEFQAPYTLAVAAESLHWMEWSIVLPNVAAALACGAFLVLADRAHRSVPWESDLAELIATYSTNQEFQPYDLVSELTARGLFEPIGRRATPPVEFSQSIEDYIESMHSRNGFSRDRMKKTAMKKFDYMLQQLFQRHCPDGIVRLPTTVRIIWGRPME